METQLNQLGLDPAEFAPASYRRVLAVRGFPALLASTLSARTANQLWSVGIILFALQRYHSATVAGLAVFVLIFPGLLLSPLGGALLDRFGRRRLMMLDFTIGGLTLLALVTLAAANHLPAWLMLVVLGVGSVTGILGVAGARSLFPLMVPRQYWDRANALDTFTYGVAGVGGPAVAGVLVAWHGGEAALAAAAVGYAIATIALLKVHEPPVERDNSASVFHDAWAGFRHVVANRTLRGLAISMSIGNFAWGLIVVALPLLVFRVHGNAAVVGAVLAFEAIVGIPAALLAGRLRTEGRERQIMAAAAVLMTAAILLYLVPALAAIFAAGALIGIADAPSNIALFSLRQRRTGEAWFGRVFAISMSLNFGGMPLGSAASGPIINHSLTAVVVLAAVLALSSAGLVMWLVPASDNAGAER